MVFNEEYPKPIPGQEPPCAADFAEIMGKRLVDEVNKMNYQDFFKAIPDRDKQVWVVGIGNNGAILCDTFLLNINVSSFNPEIMRSVLPKEIRNEYKDIRYFMYKEMDSFVSQDFQLYDRYHSFLDNNPHCSFLKITELNTSSNCTWENITWKNDDNANKFALFLNSLKETSLEKEFLTKKITGPKVYNLQDFSIDMNREIVSSDFFGNENKQLQSYVQKLSDQRIEYLRNILGFS